MNREYKFRGKRLDNGEWVYGLLDYRPGSESWSIKWWYENQFGNQSCEWALVDPKTVGQYTGLKTSKSPYTEVFEHDLVERFEGDELLEVVFEDGTFCFRDASGETFPLTKIDYVRGNIHDNPNLLGHAAETTQ